MAFVVDSSVFMTLDRAGGRLEDLRDASPVGAAYLTSIGASELLVGVHRSQLPEQQARRSAFVEALLRELPVLPFDLNVARIHAHLIAHLMSQGQLIGGNDIQIGATALAFGLDVLTENVQDFERIPGLTVFQPEWRRDVTST